MSEHQYYEFQAVDRPLSEADRKALRALSSRAQITATSFTNTYNFGDFRGDPLKLMQRWFDLHLYLANWGSRRLMIRMPERLVDRRQLDVFSVRDVEWVELEVAQDNVILDIHWEPDDGWDYDSSNDSDWLVAMAPLRADVLAGDLRLFYLLWLTGVQNEVLAPGETEPLSGIGPLTPALEAFADFFHIDPDLVAAAAERPADTIAGSEPRDVARGVVGAMADREKTDLLMRLFDGEAHLTNELRALVRDRLVPAPHVPPDAPRSVGELRARAEAIGVARELAEARKEAAEQERKAQAEAKARRGRLDEIMQRVKDVWGEIETEIMRRNPAGYNTAADLLFALRDVAEERGTVDDFTRRLQAIRERHDGKQRFLERLTRME